MFQSTHPCGVRQSGYRTATSRTCFNPRTRVGCDAKKDRAEFHFEEMFVIADTVTAEAAEVAKARLQIDTRKWALARMDKDRYGDKTQIDNTSSDGSMTPHAPVFNLNPVRPKSDD